MNKLQLYITKSFDGYKILFNINPSEDVTRHVRELRRIVEKVHYDPNEKNIFFFVRTILSGTFVAIIRTIPTNAVDHLAAWIFIPNDVIIDGETLERVVGLTTRKVSGERITTQDVAALRELFGTEYLTDSEAPAMTDSRVNGTVGWRAYNGDTGVTLTDLFGKGLFQTQYLDYCGVLFVDDDLGLTVDGDDLTGLPIQDPAVILPPGRTPEHFMAHVFGRPLDRPIRVTKEANVDFVWKHAGFEDVVSREVIGSAEFTPVLPDTSESRKSVSLNSFQITSQSGNIPLDDCTIVVNGHEITEEPRLFTTAELATAIVSINCEGYAPYSAKMDLATSTRALIRLHERTKVYCFEVPVKRADLGAPIRFKLFSKRTVKDSPLEGYSLQDDVVEGESRTNHLSYSGSSMSWTNKAIYCGIGLCVGLALGWITGCGGGAKAPSRLDSLSTEVEVAVAPGNEVTAEIQTAAPAAQPATTAKAPDKAVPSATVTADAIAYLDNNATWTKEGLEKHPSLKGLYDDMNNFRLEKLSGDWANKLKQSKVFSKLAQHATWGQRPAKKEKSKIEGDTFVKNGENAIVVQKYLNRIDP